MAPLDPSEPGESMISAPQDSSSWRRSTETFSGRTILMGYPFTLAIMARAIPVLPDEDSMICWPGRRLPSFSASSIIALAARSLTEPPGFHPSSLARMATRGLGLRELTSTIGVLPIRSRTLS